jgi:hypothetical protein
MSAHAGWVMDWQDVTYAEYDYSGVRIAWRSAVMNAANMWSGCSSNFDLYCNSSALNTWGEDDWGSGYGEGITDMYHYPGHDDSLWFVNSIFNTYYNFGVDTDVFTVALHEFGHWLALGNSAGLFDSGEVMYFYIMAFILLLLLQIFGLSTDIWAIIVKEVIMLKQIIRKNHLIYIVLIVTFVLAIGLTGCHTKSNAKSTAVTPLPGDNVHRTSNVISAQNVDQLVENSDTIIIGKVINILPSKKGVRSLKTAEIIYTDVLVSVDEYLYGQSKSDTIAIRIETGKIGNEVTIGEDEPVLTEGEHLLLFLTHPHTIIPAPEGIDTLDYTESQVWVLANI